jgi:hypothetical protein
VAKALRDDYHRLGALQRKKCGDPLSAAELEEESNLRVRGLLHRSARGLARTNSENSKANSRNR